MLISVLKGEKAINQHKILLKDLHNLRANDIITNKFM